MKKLIKILLSRRLLLIITLIAACVFTFVAFELSILPLKIFYTTDCCDFSWGIFVISFIKR